MNGSASSLSSGAFPHSHSHSSESHSPKDVQACCCLSDNALKSRFVDEPDEHDRDNVSSLPSRVDILDDDVLLAEISSDDVETALPVHRLPPTGAPSPPPMFVGSRCLSPSSG
eukprot:CAMPEP_0113710684 /NCGR_PEP_ID=MMETSP0038_2-20120614/30302_1 /TAXON_ID=2898 /ORGANISM="Cryptomonas paramecium" /LENGTH=112 /DNA_ID=CAMNT_0000636785 /DNA_START=19 /DNA_END=358 /DNA_ORIENTATION=+ /assembly_acc=CAM_ASM_000170